MTSVCEQLLEVSDEEEALNRTFTEVMLQLCSGPSWESGPVLRRRVHWSHGRKAREVHGEVFRSSGVYLWGAADCPLYIGITQSSFRKRFSRYIWRTRSQCKLAREYEAELIEKGLDGFPPEVRDWYARFAGNSVVRLQGAIRFARVGLEKVWFALFPHEDGEDIKRLERQLVRVVTSWNEAHGCGPLLNIQHAGGRVP